MVKWDDIFAFFLILFIISLFKRSICSKISFPLPCQGMNFPPRVIPWAKAWSRVWRPLLNNKYVCGADKTVTQSASTVCTCSALWVPRGVRERCSVRGHGLGKKGSKCKSSSLYQVLVCWCRTAARLFLLASLSTLGISLPLWGAILCRDKAWSGQQGLYLPLKSEDLGPVFLSSQVYSHIIFFG